MAIKCLSLWQPWASLLAHGQKRIETRSWAYRGKMPCVMAIHAAKKWDADLAAQCALPLYRAALEETGVRLTLSVLEAKQGWGLPFGAVVGLARLVGCYRADSLLGKVSEKEKAFGGFSPGRFGWVFDQFYPLSEPIPLRGHQSVWDWDAGDELEAMAKIVLDGSKAVV